VTAELRYMYERGRSGLAGAERHGLGSMPRVEKQGVLSHLHGSVFGHEYGLDV